MYLRKNKGVTLTALVITVIVMLIITSTMIYNANNHISIDKVNKLYLDIENLNGKIDSYYLKFGDIPTLATYCDKSTLKSIIEKNADSRNATLLNDDVINPNDGDEYFVIDLEKLDGLTLNYGYGDDYYSIKNNPDTISTDLDEVYIINKVTHQIYYPSGIFADNVMYYCYNLNEIVVN